jgi:hypothetical protein
MLTMWSSPYSLYLVVWLMYCFIWYSRQSVILKTYWYKYHIMFCLYKWPVLTFIFYLLKYVYNTSRKFKCHFNLYNIIKNNIFIYIFRPCMVWLHFFIFLSSCCAEKQKGNIIYMSKITFSLFSLWKLKSQNQLKYEQDRCPV